MSVWVFFMAGTLCAVKSVRASTCCPGYDSGAHQKYFYRLHIVTSGTMKVLGNTADFDTEATEYIFGYFRNLAYTVDTDRL